MTLQRPPKTSQNRPKSLPRASLFRLRFRLRFWNDFGTILAPQMPPFGHPFRCQNRSKKRSKIELQKRSPQERPKTPQELPRDPPRRPKSAPRRPKTPPRGSQDAPGTPPGAPGTPPDALPDPPGRPKMLSEGSGPITCFKKFEKTEIVERCRKQVEKKSRQRSSTVVTRIGRSKTESTFTTVGNPEGGGGGRAKRSSIRRPQRSTAC